MTDTHIKIKPVTPRVQYTGNGSTTTFPYSFAIFDETDMVVYVDDDIIESGYTVTGAGETDGGTVVFDAAPSSGKKITLLRNVPIERITDFQEGGTFRPKNINDELDRQAAFVQQVQETLDRAVKVGPTSDVDPDVVLEKVEAVYNDLDNIDNAKTWAEGSDADVAAIGGTHSAKGWAEQESDNYSVTAETSNTPRLLKERFKDIINVKDFGAKGDGVTNDTSAIESAINSLDTSRQDGVAFDLGGNTYLVDYLPRFYINNSNQRVGAHFINGYFLTESPVTHEMTLYSASECPSVISSPHDVKDTGVYEQPYSNGQTTTDYLTEGGRTTDHLCALIASQNSRSRGPGRAINIGSIYSTASGNVSGNYSSRQSEAAVQQSVNMATEECRITEGFRAANIASMACYSQAQTGENIGSRKCWAEGLHNGNINSIECVNGGYGAKFAAHITNGSISSIDIVNPGTGYTGAESIVIFDKAVVGENGGATATYSIDSDGAVTSVTVTDGGSGYTKEEDIIITLIDLNVKYNTNLASSTSTTYKAYGANVASTGCTIKSDVSANIAGFSNTIESTDTSAVVAGRNITIDGSARYSAAVASYNTTVTGGTNESTLGAFAAVGSTVTGACSVAIAANNCKASGQGSVVVGRRTINNVSRSIALGDASSGSASTANRKVHLYSNGNIDAAGTITGSVIFTDYAEYFENKENGIIPLGTIVALDGKKIKPANENDDILGVISATAFIAAGDSPFTWQGRYLRGDFGELLYHEIPDPDWEEMVEDMSWKPGEDQSIADRPMIPNPVPRGTVRVPMENPDYNPEIDNIPRSKRPEEWSCVGLLGQVYVRVANDVSVGDYIVANNGVGVKSNTKTNLRVMEIKKPGIAFCLLK